MEIKNDTKEPMEVRATPLTLEDAARMALNALDAALNLELAAKLGAERGYRVLEGLDVPAHYARIRAAIQALEALGVTAEPRLASSDYQYAGKLEGRHVWTCETAPGLFVRSSKGTLVPSPRASEIAARGGSRLPWANEEEE